MPLGATQRLRERARDNHESALPGLAAVYRPGAITPSDDFGTVTAPYTLVDTYPSNYWTMTGQEARAIERLEVKGTVVVSLPALADIDENDEIVYTVLETGETHHFLPSFVFDRDSGLTLRVVAEEYKFDS